MKHQINLSIFYKFNLTSANLYFICVFALLLHDAYTILVRGGLFTIEMQRVAAMSLSHIGYFEARDTVCTEPIYGP